jgi:hypothetical protein
MIDTKCGSVLIGTTSVTKGLSYSKFRVAFPKAKFRIDVQDKDVYGLDKSIEWNSFVLDFTLVFKNDRLYVIQFSLTEDYLVKTIGEEKPIIGKKIAEVYRRLFKEAGVDISKFDYEWGYVRHNGKGTAGQNISITYKF